MNGSLSERGVFKRPNFTFTNHYDQHKKYSNIKGLFFDGVSYHGKPTKVFSWYGVPESLELGEKAPAVVLVHGGGGTVFPDWVKKWTDHGYIAISVALEGQLPGERKTDSKTVMKWPTHKYSGPYRQGFFLDIMNKKLENQWFYHAVADIILANSLIRSFPEVDSTQVGITGISWGGILTNVVTGIDNRFDFSIPVYGCGYLHQAPTYMEQLKSHTPESKQFYLTIWEPSLYIPLQQQPTLFINGTNDGHFSMNSFTKTYNASDTKKYLHLEHEMKHGHYAGWNKVIIYSFADYITKESEAPLNLSYKKDEGTEIDYEGEVNQAVAYFTTDTANWGGNHYKWIETEAKVSKSNKTISTELPDSALYYFINATSDDGLTYSTPMRKVMK
ncbi:acetylxylan esterase [Aliifodinibius sp. S!AR15-10]|uniref:alpha/beta hydrolase family protein n=1 Tax=Aliifodinibius sp. S!AR15-10 TaxID=2950437 RepID=UPI0028545709|nr:acetylxylan esterase [Aliifodinibius sp. S!AR15-10]MDR8394553.1 acetylxylan esterase [Aliifodinibius sp. S!AR15-10]